MKSSKPFLRLISITCIVILSLALTVEYASLEELTIESDKIVYGKVKDSYSVWEDKNIYTYTSIDIIQDVKDNSGNQRSITIKQLGGSVGDITQDVSGTPVLKNDSEVFLFLVNWKNHLWIHSIILGYYEVVEREGQKVAVNNFNNVHIIDPVTKKPIEDFDEIKTSYELDLMIDEVNEILSRRDNNE